MKITRASLKTLRSRETEVRYFDDQLKGFAVRMQPSGAASYVACFRVRGATAKKTVTIGPVMALSPEQARERARLLIAAAREGRDLDRETRQRTQALEQARQALADRLTVAQAVEGYLADIADRDSPRTGRPIAASSLRAARVWLARLIERHGGDAIAEVSRAQIEAVLSNTPAKSRRNSYGAISRVWNWAKRHGHVASVLTSELERPAPLAPRTATPSPLEIRTLLETADQLVEAGRWVAVQRDAVVLILLTGQRRSEIAQMNWADIDLSRALWTQPATNKAKRVHAVPLTPRLMTLLESRWKAAGRPKAGLVLPSARVGRVMNGNLSDLAETLRDATGISFRFHDARRAVVTTCAERGIAFETLDGLLNHAAAQSRSGLRGVYNRSLLLEQMLRALTVWDDAVFGDRVLPFRKRQA